jgi:hypothetical protein
MSNISKGQKGVRDRYSKDLNHILETKTDDLADIRNLKASTIKFLTKLQKLEDKISNS